MRLSYFGRIGIYIPAAPAECEKQIQLVSHLLIDFTFNPGRKKTGGITFLATVGYNLVETK